MCVCAFQHSITNPHLLFFCRTTECVDPVCHGSVWFGNGEEHGQLVISLPTGVRNHTALMYRTRRKDTKISSLRIHMSFKSSYLIRLTSVISLSSVCVCAHAFCVNSRYLYTDCCWRVVKDVDVVVVNKTAEVDNHSKNCLCICNRTVCFICVRHIKICYGYVEKGRS